MRGPVGLEKRNPGGEGRAGEEGAVFDTL